MTRTIYITYFVHGTTTDNERSIASGHNPGELSELGKKQCIKLKDLINKREFDVVYCSDLKRAVDSAKLTFGAKVPIIQDKRLRECDYGDLTGKPLEQVYPLNLSSINKPFPNGESYKDVEKRMRSFLSDLLKKYPGKHIAIVAHRAPQLALEVIINNKTWEQAIREDWRHKEPREWRPGWDYKLEEEYLISLIPT